MATFQKQESPLPKQGTFFVSYGVQKQKIQKPEFLVNLRLSGAHEPI